MHIKYIIINAYRVSSFILLTNIFVENFIIAKSNTYLHV